MTGGGLWQATQPLPSFPIELSPPPLADWLPGNGGIPGVWTRDSGVAGPHAVITALIHGNEIAGAIVLDQLLRAPPRLLAGKLTLVFANLDAYARFDPANPTASRFADEDMNRLWDPATLECSRESSELARARVLRPVIDSADLLLDLHSMLWPGDPLILCGSAARGRLLAQRLGTPNLVVADAGHQSGRRLIDYPRFITPHLQPRAILVEAGQHWLAGTPPAMRASVDRLLAVAGLGRPSPALPPPRLAEVTHTVTAATGAFAFTRNFRGGDVIAHARTLIASDGGHEIRTPHDQCLLIMPSLRPTRGHTAVRLAKFI